MTRRRRGSGEGSITQLADGRWQARVTLPGGRRKAFYGRTRGEAARKLTVALRQLQQGVTPAAEQLTVGRFLEDWLASRRGLKPSYARTEAGHVHHHLVPALGRIRLAQLSQVNVQRFLNAELQATSSATGRPLSRSTVHHIHQTLHRALADAVRLDLVSRNVAALVRGPGMDHVEQDHLDVDEAVRLLEAAQGDPFEVVYWLALTAGLRQGEILGLRWPAVDLEQRTLDVVANLARGADGKPALVAPKTQRSRRRGLPLVAPAVEVLRRHRARQREHRIAMGEAWDASWDLVVANEVGRPCNPSNMVNRHFLPLLQRAGLRRVRFHDLRHSCASLLLALDVDQRTIQELLGHSSISVTAGYSHVDTVRLRAAVTRLGDALSGDADLDASWVQRTDAP